MTVLVTGSVVTPAPSTSAANALHNAQVLAAASQWVGMTPTWTGFDGSVWSLSDPGGGVVLTRGGIRGLSMPPVVRFTPASSPALHGTRNRGFRVDERDVFWPLYVWSTVGSADWVAKDRAFWATMRPDQTGVWSITAPDGSARSLTCRFKEDGNNAFDMLPGRVGWAVYGVSLVAESPFWMGAPTVRSWRSDPVLFPPYPVPGAGSQYVLYLSSGRTLANATARNSGDVEAWPVWTIAGPFTSAAVGVAGQQVVVPFTLAAGQSVTLNSDPSAFTATREDGTDVTGQLGQTQWSSVPPGSDVPLSLSLTGTGSVTMTLTPKYLRAW